MNKRYVSVLAIGAVTLCIIGSTAYAGTRQNEEDITSSKVQRIEWYVPEWYTEENNIVEYEVAIEQADYQFNPNTYIQTTDDNLINYAEDTTLPVYTTWTLVSDTYADFSAPELEENSKTLMRFQEFGYNEGNRQAHLARGSYAYTGEYNIRMVDGRMLIALGTHYTSTIGQYVDIELEDGTILACMLGDVKSDTHTDDTHRYQRWDKSVVEFIVDSPIVEPGADKYNYFREVTGIQSNFSTVSVFNAKVKSIRVYDAVFPIDMTDMSNDNPDMY